ncbi:MAG: hypothetical protein CMQ29_11265 [Gammaproteobacteria bacterium]|nr:hypothetical protein [Gammaproteobacteria bacterium]MBF68260.1 hypothetical protein [Gammaproteobacteria bacterium]
MNDSLGKVLLKPAAKRYRKTMPRFVPACIGNFFSNLGEFVLTYWRQRVSSLASVTYFLGCLAAAPSVPAQ